RRIGGVSAAFFQGVSGAGPTMELMMRSATRPMMCATSHRFFRSGIIFPDVAGYDEIEHSQTLANTQYGVRRRAHSHATSGKEQR
ncbi:hypothetical protein, partial [uncultured Bifidobacterium sp.]|uniref:hypothetical protein n=1 Tax=uncultured Bifidobacterium sp. TaxID=165187 RepID=UPI0026322F41